MSNETCNCPCCREGIEAPHEYHLERRPMPAAAMTVEAFEQLLGRCFDCQVQMTPCKSPGVEGCAHGVTGTPATKEDFPYDRTFAAIAAAARPQGDRVALNVSVRRFIEAWNAYPSGVAGAAATLTDAQAEALIEASDGHWKEDVFCIGGPELMALLRAARGVGVTDHQTFCEKPPAAPKDE